MEHRYLYAAIVAAFLIALIVYGVMGAVKKARHRRRLRGEYWRHGPAE
ncbi:hypothetical protein [Sphingopyxis sp. 550A]